MRLLRPSLAMLGAFAIGAGALYTLAVTGLARLAFPERAAGSLAYAAGSSGASDARPTAIGTGPAAEARAPIGSLLLGQVFSRPDRLHGRPSGCGYDPAAGAATQLGPTSAVLAKAAAERRAASVAENPGAGEPPAELLLASGSGLDPHISPESALYQVPRIAAALRAAAAAAGAGSAASPAAPAMDEAALRALVASLTEGRTLGILGEPRVNVLALNLELERRLAAAPGK